MALASVQKGLHNVSNNLNELMHAYIKHTASVLSGEDGALEGTQLSESAQNMVDEADLATKSVATLTKSLATPVAESGDAEAGKGKKRKREKKIKDPNAPKRPLTAAFLYAQSARPIIRKDLENDLPAGARLEPNAINIEVNKRWSEMSEEDKEVSFLNHTSLALGCFAWGPMSLKSLALAFTNHTSQGTRFSLQPHIQSC